MEAVKILRQLWRYRLFVAVGMALALVVGILLAYDVKSGFPPKFESRQYKVGVASAEVLVDSPSSQVADIGGGKVRTDVTALTNRARLLANLMAASPLKDQIARSAGVDPRTFVASAPSIEPSQKPSTLESAPSGRQTNVLTVYFNETLPIITADAQAPNEEVAARISTAAVAELSRYLKSVAALDKVPGARQLVVDPLGGARFATVARGPRKLFAVIAFVLIFGVWCAGTVLTAKLVRGWRQAAAEEDEEGNPAGLPPASAAPSAPHTGSQLLGSETAPPESAAAEQPVHSAPPAGPERVRELPDLPERPERPVRRNRVA
jgi:hypothetical protein